MDFLDLLAVASFPDKGDNRRGGESCLLQQRSRSESLSDRPVIWESGFDRQDDSHGVGDFVPGLAPSGDDLQPRTVRWGYHLRQMGGKEVR